MEQDPFGLWSHRRPRTSSCRSTTILVVIRLEIRNQNQKNHRVILLPFFSKEPSKPTVDPGGALRPPRKMLAAL